MIITSEHPVRLAALRARSRSVIIEHQDAGGAYVASPTFSAYRGYCWLRDGAFIADAMSAVGEVGSAGAFFDWCARVLDRHADRIDAVITAAAAGQAPPDDQLLPARFTLAGGLGADDWWDFQLDGYGTWLWALVAHADRHGIELDRWRRAAELSVDYLLSSWSQPCYDWWEEHAEQVHSSTLGCVAAGLAAAASSGLVVAERAERARAVAGQATAMIMDAARVSGHLVKWVGSSAVDASLAALIAPLRVIDPHSAVASATLDRITRDLTVDGGVHRYLGDTFYGGGCWPLLSCFVGLARSARGETVQAKRLLDWAASTATAEGLLPEQVGTHLLAPERRAEWLDRWGPVATPLLWSHAMLLRLAVELDRDETR